MTAGEQAFAADAAQALGTVVADLRSAVERLRRARPADNDQFVEAQLASVVDASPLETLLEHVGKQSGQPESTGEQTFAADTARALETVVQDLRSAVERVRQARRAINDEFVEVQLRSVVSGADRLAAQLLAYAAKQSLRPQRLELLPFLSEFASRLRQVLDQRIFVSVIVGRDCPACWVDAGALEEALLNLVVNARDAMPEGGRLWLMASADEAADGSPAVAVSVSDTGHGMPADFLKRAAQPFVTTKTHDPRSGLGLPATDGFARQSGGRLALRSLAGEGISATLTLPQARSTTALA